MFTRRHMQVVAKLLHADVEAYGSEDPRTLEKIVEFGDIFAQSNDRFDRERFERACFTGKMR